MKNPLSGDFSFIQMVPPQYLLGTAALVGVFGELISDED